MSFSSTAFANIGKVLGNSSSTSTISSSISIPKSNNVESTKLEESLSNSLNISPDDCSIVSDSQSVEFNNHYYKFYVLLCSDTNIQIKLINLNTMDEYMSYIDKTFLDDKKYIRCIKILYNIIIDAIKFSNKNIIDLKFKLVTENNIQFNIIYNTHYDKHIIPIIIPLQKKSIDEKQDLMIRQILNDNIMIKKNIQRLTDKIDHLNNRIDKIHSKFT